MEKVYSIYYHGKVFKEFDSEEEALKYFYIATQPYYEDFNSLWHEWSTKAMYGKFPLMLDYEDELSLHVVFKPKKGKGDTIMKNFYYVYHGYEELLRTTNKEAAVTLLSNLIDCLTKEEIEQGFDDSIKKGCSGINYSPYGDYSLEVYEEIVYDEDF